MTQNYTIPEQTTNILIINLHSSRNNGDAALTEVAIQQLYDNFPECKITLAMNDPESHAGKETKVGSFLFWMWKPAKKGGIRWKYFSIIQLFFASLWAAFTYRLVNRPHFWGLTQPQKKSLQAYFNADLVISAPGNFIYSSGKAGLTLIIVIYTMFYASLVGKPLYLFPQSIGPLQRNRDRKLVRWVLNRARIVMVREPISLNEIRSAGVTNPNCFLIPDVAFAFQGSPVYEAKNWLISLDISVENDQPLLGITVINWGAQTAQPTVQARYEDAIFTVVQYFLDTTSGKVIFFPQVCGSAKVDDDRVPAQRIAKRFSGNSSRIIFIEQMATPELLRTAYQFMDIFIGTRMHSNIFALSGGVPVIAIAYRPKTQGIMQMIGLEEWTIEIEKITGEAIITRFVHLWETRESVRSHIQVRVTDLAHQARQAGVKVAADYASFSRNSK